MLLKVTFSEEEIAWIDQARGEAARAAYVRNAALDRAQGRPPDERSPIPPSEAQIKAQKKALKEIETERSAVQLNEERRGLEPKGYSRPPLYERRSRGPGPIEKKR